MNNTLRILNEYHANIISNKGKIYLVRTLNEDYAIKINPLISYDKLYSYLSSRGFSYLPEIVSVLDDAVIFRYVNDDSISNYQKSIDLIHIVSLLHSKTSYFKEVSLDKYKEIYEMILGNASYLEEYYDNLFDKFILDDMYPSRYLFLRNYSVIYLAISNVKKMIYEWYEIVKNDTKQRVCLCHGNLRLEHYIRNSLEYLVSWDNYSFDVPILDLYKFYLNEWEDINMEEVLEKYSNTFELLDNEKKLLNILVLMPYKVEFNNNELDNCRNVRRLINYLNSSFKLVRPE